MSGTAAFLPQIEDLKHREALRLVHDRLSAVELTNPSIVTPQTLTTDFNANQQRLQNLKDPTHVTDLVTLAYARGFAQSQIVQLQSLLAGLFIDAPLAGDTAKPR